MEYNETFFDENKHLKDFKNFLSIAKYALPIAYGLITLMDVVGNGLVIWTILTNKKMKTPTNILILNLAAADILIVVMCVPFEAVEYVVPNYIFGTAWCKISNYSLRVCTLVSVYILVLMSLVRFAVVVYPITSKSWITAPRVCVAVAVIWVVMLGGYSPLLVQYEIFTYTNGGKERLVCNNREISLDLYSVSFFAFGFAFPLIIMVNLYGVLLIMLRCGRRTGSLESSPQRNRAHSHVTKMVIAVILCFLLCWLPLHVIFMVGMFGRYPWDTIMGQLCYLLASCLAYFNSCMNPILYAFLSSEFRQSFRQALCCCRYSDTR